MLVCVRQWQKIFCAISASASSAVNVLLFRLRRFRVITAIPPDLPYTPSVPDARYSHPLTALMAGFLASIGLETAPATITEPQFLPGLMLHHGRILIDESQLTWPGDLLHEAGHLAVIPAARRSLLHQNAGADPGEEMAAIAWSYAAALHLGIDPAVVFHAGGYRGGSQSILQNFSQRRYFGVPMLEYLGLAAPAAEAAALGVPPYPHMLKWVVENSSG